VTVRSWNVTTLPLSTITPWNEIALRDKNCQFLEVSPGDEDSLNGSSHFSPNLRTMGNGASGGGGGGEEDDPLDPFDGIDTLGYRVLGVQPDSPAAAAGLVSFLDFLVGVNDKMLLGSGAELQPGEEYDDVDLPALLEENKGVEVEFCTLG
jgi:hypothetical protein